MSKIPDKSIDLVLTDPPYDIGTVGGGIYPRENKKYIKELNDISNGFDEEIINELVRIMKKVNIYFFCSQKQIPILLDYFLKHKSDKDHILYRRKINWNIISWHKTNPMPACSNKYLTDTEFILFFREVGVKIHGSYDTKRTHYETPLWTKDKKLYNHPTCKPVFILENLIMNSSLEGELVFDPFMGSGSTGVAAVNTNRNFLGCEINKEYFDTCKERFEEYTDKIRLLTNTDTQLNNQN